MSPRSDGGAAQGSAVHQQTESMLSFPEGQLPDPLSAPQVYESLRRSPDFPEEKLAAFDGEGAEELLYEMRNLGVNLRAATAEYIADNGLDAYVRISHTPLTATSALTVTTQPSAHAPLQAPGELTGQMPFIRATC